MYKIKEASSQFHISPNALRFYEKKGLIHPAREENGYRLYSADDMARIQMILLLRSTGFSIESIAKLLDNSISPLDMFLNQYQLLNDHLHSMKLIQTSMTQCIDLLFRENSYTPDVVNHMQTTSALLAQSAAWVDKWDFNTWASSYDKDIRLPHKGLDFYKNYDAILSRTAQIARQQPGIIVEIGVGTGALASQLLDTHPIIGVDQSISMLKEAKRKCPELPVRLGTFLQLPFEDKSADCIITSYAFHHCTESERPLALQEMKRILKPGGQIIITDLMFSNLQSYEAFTQTCTPEELTDLQDEHFTTVQELENLLHSLNFTADHEQLDSLIWIVYATLL